MCENFMGMNMHFVPKLGKLPSYIVGLQLKSFLQFRHLLLCFLFNSKFLLDKYFFFEEFWINIFEWGFNIKVGQYEKKVSTFLSEAFTCCRPKLIPKIHQLYTMHMHAYHFVASHGMGCIFKISNPCISTKHHIKIHPT